MKHVKSWDHFNSGIIGDSAENDLDLVYIKELLHNAKFELCTAKEYQGGLNEVALCYSCDNASLEWPVVLHIQTVRNKRLHYQRGNELYLQFL